MIQEHKYLHITKVRGIYPLGNMNVTSKAKKALYPGFGYIQYYFVDGWKGKFLVLSEQSSKTAKIKSDSSLMLLKEKNKIEKYLFSMWVFLQGGWVEYCVHADVC